jgi:hypothetical protein
LGDYLADRTQKKKEECSIQALDCDPGWIKALKCECEIEYIKRFNPLVQINNFNASFGVLANAVSGGCGHFTPKLLEIKKEFQAQRDQPWEPRDKPWGLPQEVNNPGSIDITPNTFYWQCINSAKNNINQICHDDPAKSLREFNKIQIKDCLP